MTVTDFFSSIHPHSIPEDRVSAYNCPDNVSVSDPEAPWNKEEVDETYRFNGFYIPPRMMGAIDRYVNQGIPPGGFLNAVICNDLREAVGRADEENLANLPAFVAYFYNEVPSFCWGSGEKVAAWMGKFVCSRCGERRTTAKDGLCGQCSEEFEADMAKR